MTTDNLEELRLLRESASGFFRNKAAVSEFRKRRNQGGGERIDRDLWRSMVEMGWAGLLVPESYGGLEIGCAALAILSEEAGRHLVSSPLLSTTGLGAKIIAEAGSGDQKARYLPSIASGDLTLAFACDETGHHRNIQATGTTATRKEDSFMIDGRKQFVVDGASADVLAVLLRLHGHDSAFGIGLVDRKLDGVSVEPLHMSDSRDMAHVSFSNVEIGSDSMISSDNLGPIIESVLDLGYTLMAAEMLGLMQQAFDITVEYLKQREQFGKPLGSFQALQHRAARMYSDIELTRSAVVAAASAIDEDLPVSSVLASLAKATANKTVRLVSSEAVQMHGGIGVTDEHDIGLYLKRARSAELSLGSTHFHNERYARLRGF